MRCSQLLLVDTVRFARTLLKPRSRVYRHVPPATASQERVERPLLGALERASRGATGEEAERVEVLFTSELREILPLVFEAGGLPASAERVRAATSTNDAVVAVKEATLEVERRVYGAAARSATEVPWRLLFGVLDPFLSASRCLEVARLEEAIAPLEKHAAHPLSFSAHLRGAVKVIVLGAHAAGPHGRAVLRDAIARASWCGEHEDCRANRELAIACAASRVARGAP